MPVEPLSELRRKVLAVVLEKGYRRLDQPLTLASGESSRDYVDGKRAFALGSDLRLACQAIVELARDGGAHFDAVGGLTLGADPFAHGCAVLDGSSWFVVRKQAKDHGTKKRVEGAELRPGANVLLVEDVVTTGGSMIEALEAVRAMGATVAFAATVVDRGDVAAKRFSDAGVPFGAVLTYRDLGIDPVGPTEGPAVVAAPSAPGGA